VETLKQPAEERAQIRSGKSRFLAVVAIGLASLVAAIVAASRGRFRELIAEFDIPLSMLTSFAVGPVLPVFLATIVVITVAKEFMPLRGSVVNLWNGCAICLAAAGLAIYLAGVFAPLLTLIKSLS
jgi:hypothetical protein